MTLQQFIDSQDWLSPEEKQLLLAKLNISNPPSRQGIADWKKPERKRKTLYN